MSVAKIRWYLARLAAMSPAEVGHRVIELARKTAWRKHRAGWDTYASVGDGPLLDAPELRVRQAKAAQMSGEAIAALQRGQWHGLGRTVRADAPHVWFTDPVKGQVWPGADTYCFDVDVRSTGQAYGDIKFIWEINRLQVLHPLCTRIAAKADTADIALALGLIRDWMEKNPPYRGINWFSGIELAMRLVSVALVIIAARPSAFQPEDRILLRRFIAAHGFWLARYPSRFSSANNHLMAEGLGLYLAGILAPDLADAQHWEAEGRAILEQEILLQVHADGVGGEQSPTYQAFTMEMVALAALIGEKTGKPFSAALTSRLVAGARFLQQLCDAAGHVPHIGDDDEGRVLAQPPDREPRYAASVIAAIAGLVGDASLTPPARDAHFRDALFDTPAHAASAPLGLHLHDTGGYAIAREWINGHLAVLTFDHGPLGYLSLAAHGHADALAVWLSVDDQPVLVDAGTYLYHSGGAQRNALRSSLAHNTLAIENQSQSLPSSAFSWSHRAEAERIVQPVSDPARWSISARHDGYRKRFGVEHRRSVLRVEGGFDIEDWLDGNRSERQVWIGFLIHPDLHIAPEGTGFAVSRQGVPLVLITPPEGFSGEIVGAPVLPGTGQYSPRFGEITNAPHLVLSGMMLAGPARSRIQLF